MASLSPFSVIKFLSLNSANSVKTFRKNSNVKDTETAKWQAS